MPLPKVKSNTKQRGGQEYDIDIVKKIKNGLQALVVQVLKKSCNLLKERSYSNPNMIFLEMTFPMNYNIFVTHEFKTHSDCHLIQSRTFKGPKSRIDMKLLGASFKDDVEEFLKVFQSKYGKQIPKVVVGGKTDVGYTNVEKLTLDKFFNAIMKGESGNTEIQIILEELQHFFEFHFPEQVIPEKVWTEELPKPSNTNLGMRPSKAYDYFELEEFDVDEYIQKNPNENIVLFLSGTSDAFFYEAKRLETDIEDDNKVVYPCVNQAIVLDPTVRPVLGIDMRMAMLRLNLTNLTVKVPIKDVHTAIEMAHNGEENIFVIVPTDLKFKKTASFNAAFPSTPNSWVSADHCQTGSDITVYRLLPFTTSNIGGAFKKKSSSKRNVKKPVKDFTKPRTKLTQKPRVSKK